MYDRRLFASRPDDVVVVHFTQKGGGRCTGTVTLEGTHGEKASGATSFAGALPNGSRYAAAVTARGSGGTVRVDGCRVTFSKCTDLTVVVSGGTDYAPDASAHYRNPSLANPPRCGSAASAGR